MQKKLPQQIVKSCQQFSYQKNVCGVKRNFQFEMRVGLVRFRGPISSSGLEFFDSFLGQCQKE
jgi:hypothetical protein